MYLFYLNDILLPITPSKLSTKVGGNNSTISLANSGEVNLIKFPKLAEYEFEVELLHGIDKIGIKASNLQPKTVLDFLEKAKKEKLIVSFRVVRKMGNSVRFAIDQKVTVENYEITEDAENNSDITVKLELKAFRPYRTKHLKDYDKSLGKREEPKTETHKKKEEKKKVSSVPTLKRIAILHDLNIRSGAGTNNKKFAYFKKGDKPVVYAETKVNGKTWYKIKHSKGDNGYGWISGDSRYSKVDKDLKK